MEIFYSIQGEGYHTGMPAIFIRLGGCDVGCVWCDVKDSWNENDHPFLTVSEILMQVQSFPSKTIIVTGGEPLMYDLTELTSTLAENKYKIHLETSGVYPITGSWNWICFSPKKFKKPHFSIYEYANELKSIIFHKNDFEFAEMIKIKVSEKCYLCLQPEW
jgi:organic radical activating enzyme